MKKQLTIHQKQKRKNNRKVILAILFALAILIPASYHLFYKPKQVRGNYAILTKKFTDHRDVIWVTQFSPDGEWLASGSIDSTVKIRNLGDGSVITLANPSGVTGIAFSPDGRFLIASGYDQKVRLWDIQAVKILKTFSGPAGTVWTVAFSSDGKTIAGAGDDKKIFIWDIETGNTKHVLNAHDRTVWSLKFSPDGKSLVSGSYDRTVKLWDVQSGKLVQTINGHKEAVVAVTYSHDGKMIASTADDCTVRLWNANDGTPIKILEKVPEHVQGVAFSPDNRRIVAGGRDKTTFGELLQNFIGESEFNHGVSFRLFDIESGKIIQTFSEHTNDANDVVFSPDGKFIASASADHTVHLWKLVK